MKPVWSQDPRDKRTRPDDTGPNGPAGARSFVRRFMATSAIASMTGVLFP